MSNQADRPKAVVVGTSFGCRIHVPALREAGFDVAGLVGTDADKTARRAEKAGIPASFTDLDTAIAQTGAVAVTIASPPATHKALALTAIARGCHVLCEKPMAADTAEAQAMLDAAQAAGVTHLLGNEFRWAPERALVATAIADGMIGEPRLCTLTSFMPLVADTSQQRMPGWWFDEAAGGGWLGAHGSHIVDQLRTWLGDVESLSAALPMVSDRPADAAEDSYSIRFHMTNGAEAVLQHTAGAWGPMLNVSRVAGTRGTVWSEGAKVFVADSAGTRELDVPDNLVLPRPALMDDPAKAPMLFELPPFIRLCEVLRAAVDGRPPSSAVAPPTFADGLAAMRVLDAVRRSAIAGGELVRIATS
jgi:predicted dehydrogenase